MALSSDACWLVSGGEDGSVLVWPLPVRDVVQLACRTTGRDLSEVEREQYLQGEPVFATCPGFSPAAGAQEK